MINDMDCLLKMLERAGIKYSEKDNTVAVTTNNDSNKFIVEFEFSESKQLTDMNLMIRGLDE